MGISGTTRLHDAGSIGLVAGSIGTFATAAGMQRTSQAKGDVRLYTQLLADAKEGIGLEGTWDEAIAARHRAGGYPWQPPSVPYKSQILATAEARLHAARATTMKTGLITGAILAAAMGAFYLDGRD